MLTKQAFGLWGVAAPREGFVHADVSDEVAAQAEARVVLDAYTGQARVVGCTVLHGRGKPPRAVVLADVPDDQRALATTEDAAWVTRLQQEEFVGRDVRIAGQELVQ